MSVVTAILIWGLLGMLTLVVLACIMPLRLELALHKHESWAYTAALRPFAGLGPQFWLMSGKKKSKTQQIPRSKHRKAADQDSERGIDWRHDPLGMVRATTRLTLGILRCVHIDKARIDMTFGLGDPADTGQAFGVLAPVVYSAGLPPKMQIEVAPVFDRTVLRGHADLNISLIPVLLLPALVRFGWSIFGPTR